MRSLSSSHSNFPAVLQILQGINRTIGQSINGEADQEQEMMEELCSVSLETSVSELETMNIAQSNVLVTSMPSRKCQAGCAHIASPFIYFDIEKISSPYSN